MSLPLIHKKADSNGFTLLEVMIGMAICGILFLGIGSAMQQQVRSVNYLEKKAAADQLVWNLMESYRLEGKPLEPDYLEGIDVMGNHQLKWTRKISTLEDSDLVKLEIKAGEPDGGSLVAQGWLWR